MKIFVHDKDKTKARTGSLDQLKKSLMLTQFKVSEVHSMHTMIALYECHILLFQFNLYWREVSC